SQQANNFNQIIIRCFLSDTTCDEQNFYIDQLRRIGPIRYFRITDDMDAVRSDKLVLMSFYDLNNNEKCNNIVCPIVLEEKQRFERPSLQFRPNRSNGIFRFNEFPNKEVS
ncbi:unnamed protein product, partial [Brachionus calyciflorus]